MSALTSASRGWASVAARGAEACLLLTALILPLPWGTAVRSSAIGLACALVLLRIGLERDWARLLNWPNVLVALFGIAAALSCLFSVDPAYSWRRLEGDFVVPVAIFFAVSNAFRTKPQWQRLAVAVVLGFAFVVGSNLDLTRLQQREFVKQFPHLLKSGTYVHSDGRLYGYFNWSTLYAGYLALLLPVVFSSGAVWRSRLWKVAVAVVVAFGLLNLAWTGTRAAWGGTIVAAFSGAWLARRTWKPMAYSLGLFGLAGLIFVASNRVISRRFRLLVTDPFAERTVEDKLTCWRVGLRMLADRPIFGFGFGRGTFYQTYPRYRGENDPQEMAHTHNNFLQVPLETGLVGAAFFFAFWAFVLVRLVRTFRQAQEPAHRALVLGCLLGLIALFISGLTESSFQKGDLNRCIWLVGGMSVALILHLKPRASTQS